MLCNSFSPWTKGEVCEELASSFHWLFSNKAGLFARIGVNMTQLQFGGLLPDTGIYQVVSFIPKGCLVGVTGTGCEKILQFCLLRALLWNHFLYT